MAPKASLKAAAPAKKEQAPAEKVPAEIPAAEVLAAEVPAAEVPAAEVPAAEVPTAEVAAGKAVQEEATSSTAAPTITTAAPAAVPTAQISETYARVQAKVGLALEPVLVRLEPIMVKAQDGTIYVKAKVGHTIVYIKAKLSTLGETSVVKFVVSVADKVDGAVRPRIVYIQTQVGGIITDANTKALAVKDKVVATHADVHKAVEGFLKTAMTSLADKYTTAQVKVQSITEPVVAKAKGKYTFICGKVSDAVVVIKTKRDVAKQKALESYAAAAAKVDSYVRPTAAYVAEKANSVKAKTKATFEPVFVKIEGGVVYIKAKIDNQTVFIKAKVSSVKDYVTGLFDTYVTPLKLKVIGSYEYLVCKAGNTIVYIRTEVATVMDAAKVKALATYAKTLELVDGYTAPVRTRALALVDDATTVATAAIEATKTKAAKVGGDLKVVAKDEKFQATAGTAVSGAVALGASAGAAGFVTGGAVGAMVGVVPAIFTFGLSIPIGAAMGAGTGLCVGTVGGGTVGLVGGGAVGYGVQTHKKEIGDAASKTMSKVSSAKDYVKDTAANSATYLKSKIRSGTGGTA